MVVDDQNRLVLTAVYVLDENNDVLLLTRKDDGSLEPPGGKLESTDCENDSLQEISREALKRCAVRELFEELGQTFIIEELDYLGSIPIRISGSSSAIIHAFSTRLLFGEPILNEPDSFSSFSWFSPSSLLSHKYLQPDILHFCSVLVDSVDRTSDGC